MMMRTGHGSSGRLPRENVPLIRYTETDTITWLVLSDATLVKDGLHFHTLSDGQDLPHGIEMFFFIVNIVGILDLLDF